MMKKCYSALMAILLALVSVGFAACGDDDEPMYYSDIFGTWSFNSGALSDDAIYFQFTKDGKFHEVQTAFADGETRLVDVFHGTYTISGNLLTITFNYTNEDEIVKCLYKVKDDKLTLTFEDEGEEGSVTFTRVKDSVIAPYL